MTRIRLFLVLLVPALLLAVPALLLAVPALARTNVPVPSTIVLSGQVLAKARQDILLRDRVAVASWETLKKRAEAALTTKVETITAKPVPFLDAEPHDYVSISPYWWPDPKMPGGLPYVRRDGEPNPEADSTSYDKHRLAVMARTVETLALAYWFSGDERYADRAAAHLRAWFLDRATRMNPNMDHAQRRPGLDHGNHTGIIEARHLIRVVDAARLLAPSNAWTDGDDAKLQAWFSKFADWLVDSDFGKAEDRMENNHATWYDAQLTVYLLYTDRQALAETVVFSFPQRRLRLQIDQEGRQPLEEQRTRPRHYVFFNLQGLFTLASAIQSMGLNLWQATIYGEPAIKAALDRAAPYLDPSEPWPGAEQAATAQPFDPRPFVPLFRRAAVVYKDPNYLDRLKFLPAGELAEDPGNLFY